MLALNQTLNSHFETFFNEAIEGGTLPEREKVVAILTSATLLNDQKILKNAVLTAKQLGFTKEEIGQVTAIAIAVNSQRLKDSVEIKTESSNTTTSTCCQ
ncbi:carboxymuconolactone decarboxylase family protein [Priestia endophytica]|uniref:carboxymuconolactone decarboxylase family protein n=1 Tax=Priestia endophytica TaxID=135735 RepID=UPI0022803AE6|nr:carboxymuconolactone decarboxylase family protein [Priestia endophytica]MCY8234413.1 carboxymuconolactone decarboxylase family protein [Priestia endophytica]